MYRNNPEPSRWPAVACYNKAWSVKNRGAISDVVSMRLNLGAFHTDYDCMYVGHNNQLYTEAEGGYINVCSSSSVIPLGTDYLFCSLPTRTTADTAALMDAPGTLPATREYCINLRVGEDKRVVMAECYFLLCGPVTKAQSSNRTSNFRIKLSRASGI
jgi:hypothetical protein